MREYSYSSRLQRRFEKQAAFAAGYSPLCSRLCSLVSAWFDQEDDPVIEWLSAASGDRLSFEVPMLLLAGVHHAVLSGAAESRALAPFFPTVGGHKNPGAGELDSVLHQTIEKLQPSLTSFIQTAQVQTNETGRGIGWLLPLYNITWKQVHLVDMGCSAGLNLVADKRQYQIVQDEGKVQKKSLFGHGKKQEFVVSAVGHHIHFSSSSALPAICSRIGCDIAPYELTSSQEERALAAFIWGDQVERMARLQEAFRAFTEMKKEPGPFLHLYQVDIAKELAGFLDSCISPLAEQPIVLYNSYLTNYLADKGRGMKETIGKWAGEQEQPVCWIQMELPHNKQTPPSEGWLLWQVDLWQGKRHDHWDLAWSHPHGTKIEWLAGMEEWQQFWQTM